MIGGDRRAAGARASVPVVAVLFVIGSACSRTTSAPDVSVTVLAGMADLARVTADEETRHQDLPGIEGFDDLPSELQAQVLARANRSRCDCGCVGHSVNACLHGAEACDIAKAIAAAFVDDARALALVGAPGSGPHPGEASSPVEPTASREPGAPERRRRGRPAAELPRRTRTGAGVMSAAGPDDEEVVSDEGFAAAGGTSADGELPAAGDDDRNLSAGTDAPPTVLSPATIGITSETLRGPPGSVRRERVRSSGSGDATEGPLPLATPGAVQPLGSVVPPQGTSVEAPAGTKPGGRATPPGVIEPLGPVIQPPPGPTGTAGGAP